VRYPPACHHPLIITFTEKGRVIAVGELGWVEGVVHGVNGFAQSKEDQM
jgi:hypothetical protein